MVFYITASILLKRILFYFNDLTPNRTFLVLQFKYINLKKVIENVAVLFKGRDSVFFNYTVI